MFNRKVMSAVLAVIFKVMLWSAHGFEMYEDVKTACKFAVEYVVKAAVSEVTPSPSGKGRSGARSGGRLVNMPEWLGWLNRLRACLTALSATAATAH